MKNLSQKSKAYYQDNDYYEIFSASEDASGEVGAFLKEISSNKTILDAGCGTGKYLEILEANSKEYVGVDLSYEQIKKAQNKVKKSTTKLICANLKEIPLPDNYFDLIISSWVLGTILDLEERHLALEELKRVLKPNGKIILVENAEKSFFEKLRGHDVDGKTKVYNNWLIENGFSLVKTFDDYFLFPTLNDAQKCFEVIYGKKVSTKVVDRKIEHAINIYEYHK